MKKLLGGLAVAGVAAGAALAARSYLSKSGGSGEEAVQITFNDNTSQALTSKSAEGQEFTDIARKLVQIGV